MAIDLKNILINHELSTQEHVNPVKLLENRNISAIVTIIKASRKLFHRILA
jgi:hypothetical protein